MNKQEFIDIMDKAIYRITNKHYSYSCVAISAKQQTVAWQVRLAYSRTMKPYEHGGDHGHWVGSGSNKTDGRRIDIRLCLLQLFKEQALSTGQYKEI